MLKQWLGETSLEDFARLHLRKEPLARPSAATAAVPLFDWSALERILREPSLDALVVRAGMLVECPQPRDVSALRQLFSRGVGIVVRRAERQDAALRELACAFAADLPGETHVQLFVTPRDSVGFGWHYDAEDVFILQTAGEKSYYFRRNTLAPDLRPGAQPDFTRVATESSPIQTCTLLPGDWLYVPRGWWHVARATHDSLSISLGVLLDRDLESERS